MREFDTCFFERYARNTLIEMLGNEFACLTNEDRPDLQSPDHQTLGIEVTRAMEESRNAEHLLLKEMAGIKPCLDDLDPETVRKVMDSGYGYGLDRGQFVGPKEYDYWALALPLKRILESKVEKARNGFYGRFESMGLYVFCKDDITDESVSQTCSFFTELQSGNEIRYDKLYLSEISNLYVCNFSVCPGKDCVLVRRYPISKELRRNFFMESLAGTH